ncbi:GNAT domain-containing protein [Xylariales sp. PMI_506]|nr:GNAT domain-containing protein [Xylariales sp. PMI_506]
MKFNENITISTPKVLLVPYDAHHVPRYHAWMEDAAIREATASDRLTLEEEYENQISWRTSADKLTFIVCRPLAGAAAASVAAGEADADNRMVGDINLFLTPWDYEEEEGGDGGGAAATAVARYAVGEVDIMIADTANRGRGMGRAAVSAFLWYIWKNRAAILKEYATSPEGAAAAAAAGGGGLEMKQLLVRIKATNEGSIALFKGLGFEQKGDVNYFGEIEMVLQEFSAERLAEVEGYQELPYDRTKLKV